MPTSFTKRIAEIINEKFDYFSGGHILQRNITNDPRSSSMTVLEFLPIALAVLAVVARVAMFLPRQPKSTTQAR